MQLSSRILTALAVLILAVAVVAVRAGSPGTVEAATGTIDVVNVGTCYTTDTDVFDVSACEDGDGGDYNVAERTTILETGSVFATYAHDPKTAPDDPRGVLKNSNRIKISISDSGRDKRTPVLLPAGAADPGAADGEGLWILGDNPDTPDVQETDFRLPSTDLLEIRKDFADIVIDDDDTGLSWQERGEAAGDAFTYNENGVEEGVTIIKNTAAIDAGTVFKPMDVADESLVTIYGTLRLATPTGAQDPPAPVFKKLNNELSLDEDVGSGYTEKEQGPDSLEVAPWISLQVSLPAGASVEVEYIVYHTSEREALIGGNKAADYVDVTTTTDDESKYVPDFTKAEDKAVSELLVEARSDGRANKQALHLMETSRFSGRYEGYLMLTDENGDESGNNWGIAVKAATGSEPSGAAVIGVESGPVDIVYRDTDGKPKTLSVLIDTVPPTVQVDTPVHESEGQDTSPNFSGSYTDDSSGLRQKTFRLYVDHNDDTEESGEQTRSNGSLALDIEVDVSVVPGKDVVESLEDYRGYDNEPTFGVIADDDVFLGEDVDSNNLATRKIVEGDNHDDGALDGTFGDSIRISFTPDNEDETFNNTIDFHALVVDVAGNIGFSDSDPDGPRFINDLGEEKPKTGRYNVLGWYARHIFFLDETEPEIFQEQSATGFYSENDDGDPVANRSGILVAFDRAVDADSIGVDTFGVTLDPIGGPGSTGASADVVDIDVDGRAVYLLLDQELLSDATPSVDIVTGQWVADPAGNRLTGGKQAPFEVNDGITPQLTVALSGGSGTGDGGEGPSSLTGNSIIITIGTDEEISATPSIAVVCSDIAWDSDSDGETDKGLSDLVGQRSGALTDSSAIFSPDLDMDEDPNLYGDTYKCGTDEVKLQQVQSYSRPGLEWEFQWVNFSNEQALEDGKLTVVAYGRDRKSYASLTPRKIDADPTPVNRYNWGAATAEFLYDTTDPDPNATPGDGEVVTESRPFVLLNYTDATTVSIDDFSVDGTSQEISTLGDNRFLYWPEALGIGSHAVSVDAVDAAGNEGTFEYSFKVAERDPFNLKLIAGWNAVSFPGNPIDPMIGDVFTEDVIDMVAGWDATDPQKPWSIATKMEGEWSTHTDFATLNRVSARYGYWVHAQGFVTQKVQLVGQIDRTDANVVPADLVTIPTEPGWNFVGVISQDGRQTQSHDGKPLMTDGDNVSSGSYLGDNKRAYTWDAIRSEFKILENGDDVTIGDGIWVYYGGGIAP